MNLLDRAIDWVAPAVGLRRARERYAIATLRRGYEGARTGRRSEGWVAAGTGANTEIAPALARLRDRSRDLVRNNPYAAKAVGALVSNLVGRGIVPRARDDSAEASAWMVELCAVAGGIMCDPFAGSGALARAAAAARMEGIAIELEFAYTMATGRRLTFIAHEVHLPEPRRSHCRVRAPMQDKLDRLAATRAPRKLVNRQGVSRLGRIAAPSRRDRPAGRAAARGAGAARAASLRLRSRRVIIRRHPRPGTPLIDKQRADVLVGEFAAEPAPATPGPIHPRPRRHLEARRHITRLQVYICPCEVSGLTPILFT